ncbi:hypothetical protein [Haloarcula sp. JP-L23]|uniref:hypothetical protein n=1 Tax=Haloarcula sp. JP-L23 TaxID=2716717 RepID=UPI00140F0F04|nr:hypothetical protein G9465_08955 [Haloarcula sp. JP-L23]
MSLRSIAAGWLPEAPPTWDQVIVTALASVSTALTIYETDAVSWAALGGAFAVTVAVAGPVAQSSVGRRLRQRAPRLGRRAVAVGIAVFAVVVWVTVQTIAVPASVVTALGTGIVLGVAVLVVFQAASTGTISGWSERRPK